MVETDRSFPTRDNDIPIVEKDVLIVGAGPAGASLGCFLGSNGITGLIVSASSSSAKTPRAHYTNPAALECLRDIGLEDVAMKRGIPEKGLARWYRFSKTMCGGEIARRFTFGNSPHVQGPVFEASPCQAVDFPQTVAEPMLVTYASHHGFQTRYSTRFISFVDDGQHVTSTLEDTITGHRFRVKSRFLAGADGAKSSVAAQLALPFTGKPGGGVAMNVLLDADLSHLMRAEQGGPDNTGLLHICFAQDKERPDWGVMGAMRAIKPWTEWLIILLAAPGVEKIDATPEQIHQRCREFIGDDSVDVTVKDTSVWTINEAYAEQVSKGNVFGIGDSIHRHPPFNGLGSNTCIQDAYNLAWKMAAVLKGHADRSLLDTYNVERQPIAKQVVTRANDSGRLHQNNFNTLGLLLPTPEARLEHLHSLTLPGAANAAARQAAKANLETLEEERAALGAEMNQCYTGSGVYTADEDGPPPALHEGHQRDLVYVESTYPGKRLPHAWIGLHGGKAEMGKMQSTQDLTKRGWMVITGIGGTEVWREAVETAKREINGLNIGCVTIGWGQECEDVLGMWEAKRGVEEEGCVLVRPDRVVAWRCANLSALEGEAEAEKKLVRVVRSCLGFSP